ncbi:zinc transporter 77C isoform 1-T2 [Cochliomyia hominivorax]
MPIKGLLYRFQPAPLYTVLILSICNFSVQLILSHLTHSLTLLMASYHMLCNIFALAGSIVTIKHNELFNEQELSSPLLSDEKQKSILPVTYPKDTNMEPVPNSSELKIRNTFGWARIEILTMLIVCITLASLSFSLLIESVQTLVHIDHQDSMHLPVHVMILGFVGLLLNGFTYYIIGGYTLHQGSFLHINPRDGKVRVEPSNITVDGDIKILAIQDTSRNDTQLKEDLKSEIGKVHYRIRREGPAELLRDVSSTIFVIVCAVIVYFAKDKEHTAKFIDPVLAIFSCVLVVALSYPYMKEACLILLQTIPANIDMGNFEKTLMEKFPQIVSIHELHIWQMSSHKYIATVHIIFKNSQLYTKTIDEVRQFFHDHSIVSVTIQPEFSKGISSSAECLLQCQKPECLDKVCCKDSMNDLRDVTVCSGPNGHEHEQGHGHAHNHGHAHGHGKKSCKGKKHGHSHKHDHSHGLKHDHCHDKHAHDAHKHTNYNHAPTEIPEVPKEIVNSEVKQIESTKETVEECVQDSNIPVALTVKEDRTLAEETAAKECDITRTSTINLEKTDKLDSEMPQDSGDKIKEQEQSVKK